LHTAPHPLPLPTASVKAPLKDARQGILTRKNSALSNTNWRHGLPFSRTDKRVTVPFKTLEASLLMYY
jgi:hypothetical protein